MPPSDAPSEASLAALYVERDKLETELARVRDLLDRADARRRAEPDNERHWNRTLDGLENSLDTVRRRLERVRDEIHRRERPAKPDAPAAGTEADKAQARQSDSARTESAQTDSAKSDSAKAVSAAEHILAMPVEELRAMNLGELEGLTASAAPERKLPAREPAAPTGASKRVSRTGRMLRSAMAKLRLGLRRSLTPGEREQLQRLRQHLERQEARSADEERLLKMLHDVGKT